MKELAVLEFVRYIASVNLAFLTWPMTTGWFGRDLSYGILWTVVITAWIYKKWLKPWYEVIDIEFKEISRRAES